LRPVKSAWRYLESGTESLFVLTTPESALRPLAELGYNDYLWHGHDRTHPIRYYPTTDDKGEC